ncbi:MAG: hypothetical protein ACW99Q_05390, partial [Candidatus Kariarchaeaceae archaeon]
KGKVRNLEVLDSTGKARLSLWDLKTNVIEEKSIEVGNVVRITGGSTKMGYQDEIEITLSQRGSIDLESDYSETDFPSVEHAPYRKLSEITPEHKNVSIQGKIVDRQDVVEFDKDDRKGRVANLFIDDGTKKVRLIFWNETVDIALSFDKGAVIKAVDLRVGINKYDDIELTFNNYSKIEPSEDEFSEIDIVRDITINSLSDIKDGMKGLTVSGKLVYKSEIRTFERNGTTGKVGSISIQDSSQSIKVNLWGEATAYLDSMEEGSIVRIHKVNSSLSNFSGEIEISANERSKIEISNDEVDADMFETEMSLIQFSDINIAKSGVNIRVSITGTFDPREITRNDGTTSQVQNLSVVDKNGIYGRIAAWDDNISKVSEFKTGEVIQLNNVKIKPSSGTYGPEIVILRNTGIQSIDDTTEFDNFISTQNSYEVINLSDSEKLTTTGSKIQFDGSISSTDNFVIYDGCPECQRKVYRSSELEETGECSYHGEVKIVPKMVLTITISDENGSAKVTFFNDQTEKLFGFSSEEAKDMIDRLGEQEAPIKKSDIINKNITINGSVSFNENRDEYSIRVNYFKI